MLDRLAFMELNSDFSRRVAVHGAKLAWVPSPIAGVDRRMLERIGAEVARATSIVRYAPHSHFSPHTHGGGEEFLVLEGVFQDEHGDFPVGSYIRNPPTTSHTPGSASGCTIFVKLWQFDPSDRQQVRIDTTKDTFSRAKYRPGVETITLFVDDFEAVRLERWAPGAHVALDLPAGGELLVLDGSFVEADDCFEPQSWLRLPVGGRLSATAGAGGCNVWIKTGHLTDRLTAPVG